jgi:hypothetical protein
MPLDIIVGVAVGAAAASPAVRKTLRQGLVYGLAGALIAYDKVTAVAQGAVEGARHGAAAASGSSQPAAPETNPNGAAAPVQAAGSASG